MDFYYCFLKFETVEGRGMNMKRPKYVICQSHAHYILLWVIIVLTRILWYCGDELLNLTRYFIIFNDVRFYLLAIIVPISNNRVELPVLIIVSFPNFILFVADTFYHLPCKQATIMQGELTKCVNGAITAAYVGYRAISGLLIVFITNSFKRYAVWEHIISRASLAVITSVFCCDYFLFLPYLCLFLFASRIVFSINGSALFTCWWVRLLILVSSYHVKQYFNTCLDFIWQIIFWVRFWCKCFDLL